MMQVAKTSRHLAYSAVPTAAVLLASFAWDADFKLVAPAVAGATIAAGFVSYVRNPNGRWWLSGLVGGIAGLLLGITGLFYVASQI